MSTTSLSQDTRPIRVALIGNPNTGKSTLFNSLAGMNARVGNYPGVTVEKKIGRVQWNGNNLELVDLPGTYSLSPRTLDEMLAVDVLIGRQADVGSIDVVVCIADAANLERNLYLASQVLDLGLPTVLVLNMWDTVKSRGMTIDVNALEQRLGVPVVVAEAHRKKGIDGVRKAILEATGRGCVPGLRLFSGDFYEECDKLAHWLAQHHTDTVPPYLLERMLLDVGGHVQARYDTNSAHELPEYLSEARDRLREHGHRIPMVEAKVRYAWARDLLADIVTIPKTQPRTRTDRIDRLLTHRVLGLTIFCALMFLIFQAIYSWAGPVMFFCEVAQDQAGSVVEMLMAPGALRSLLVDGVVAGMGSVMIFLPQIVLLFFFIALLEDCGYMARAAFLMDRVMIPFGLSGKSFVPLMSSFACAVPGVMATRVIEHRRDRMITILVAPLMSCSARLPIYLLLIAAFIPSTTYLGGWVSLHGLVLFCVASLGTVVAIPVACVLRRTLFEGETTPFAMELPEYKLPSVRIVCHRVYDRGKAFLLQAGTLIFATTIVVWAAGYFPGDHTHLNDIQAKIEQIEREVNPSADSQQELAALVPQRNVESGRLIESSLLGQLGHLIAPVVKPVGWDWRIGVGVIASFPAREVVISTLGTIYSLGGEAGNGDEGDGGVEGAMHASTWPDGRKVYNIPVALSIMVFFALCAQCSSTLMTIRRETNSWFWPAFCFTYMTILAYTGALITYQTGMLIGAS